MGEGGGGGVWLWCGGSRGRRGVFLWGGGNNKGKYPQDGVATRPFIYLLRAASHSAVYCTMVLAIQTVLFDIEWLFTSSESHLIPRRDSIHSHEVEVVR